MKVVVLAFGMLLAQTGITQTSSTPFPKPGAAATTQTSAAAPAGKTAGETLKNVQVLKDVPAGEWNNVMFFIAGSLGVGCEHCHTDAYEADTKRPKQIARQMMQMVREINATQFEGKPVVTCNTCHRGSLLPQAIPNLWNKTADEIAEYKRHLQDDRAATPASPAAAAARSSEPLPTAEEVFDKYRHAVGAGSFTTLHLTATIVGDIQPSQEVEYDVVFPDKVAVRVSLPGGATRTVVINGDRGWLSSPQGTRNVDPSTIAGMKSNPLIQAIKFPEVASSAKVTGFEHIGNRTCIVVESHAPRLVRLLYFDAQSGLLYKTRVETSVASFGISPAETIFDDYRDVAGVKVPFSMTGLTTADRLQTRISEIRANAPVDLARFEPPRSVSK